MWGRAVGPPPSLRERRIMNWRCTLGHQWKGCCCERCGAVRDEGHDWEHCRCRRCGLNRPAYHAWQGCVCVVCGKTTHLWTAGVCGVCGERCAHEEQGDLWGTQDDPHTAHIRQAQVCYRCGMVFPRQAIGKSPGAVPSGEPVGPARTVTGGMAEAPRSPTGGG